MDKSDESDEELEARRARIRADFPIGTAIADACRAEFGEGVTILYMSEGGREIGKMPEGHRVHPVYENETPAEVKRLDVKPKGSIKRGRKR